VVWAMPAGGSEADQFKPTGLDALVVQAIKRKR